MRTGGVSTVRRLDCAIITNPDDFTMTPALPAMRTPGYLPPVAAT
jgi:hypothetical protein